MIQKRLKIGIHLTSIMVCNMLQNSIRNGLLFSITKLYFIHFLCVTKQRGKYKKKKNRRTKNEKNFKSKGCENVMKKKRENRFIMSFYISIIHVCVCDFNRSIRTSISK